MIKHYEIIIFWYVKVSLAVKTFFSKVKEYSSMLFCYSHIVK